MGTTTALRGRTSPVFSFGSSPIGFLWLSVFVLATADVVTTWVGVGTFGLMEGNPYAATMLVDYGFVVMLPLKLGAIGFAIGMAGVADDRYDWMFPVALSLFWLFVVVWNLRLLALIL